MSDNNETVSQQPPDALEQRQIFLKELKRIIIQARVNRTLDWLVQNLGSASDSLMEQIDDKLNTLVTLLLTNNSNDAQQQPKETTLVYAMTGSDPVHIENSVKAVEISGVKTYLLHRN
ncbi:uncharacterized protein LOC132797683 [Drosophila nasuta]|uniref:uncharacterized protein LOC132797648 n=1 Tax=Drosophila nasuta TaxID=42062 RepID=UPI001471CDB0|nr:uncharacterized protein LOC132797648 [Drosophila nasuta]XP_060665411.1 uncharacterized protein LOC132797679 [Drosophila nasuta]XP_060665413.1 uncharacterized protein LOC132797681 [Drosophila nasuta]XP_060665414.1 uncharacterized protein LOC132797682 [Drosophila nasuta]XP_060665415.1 uncharacterized protein LOC132797683 [Drosophila nasuta]